MLSRFFIPTIRFQDFIFGVDAINKTVNPTSKKDFTVFISVVRCAYRRLLDTIFNSKAVALPLKITRSDVKKAQLK